jgi:hypothetical protein
MRGRRHILEGACVKCGLVDLLLPLQQLLLPLGTAAARSLPPQAFREQHLDLLPVVSINTTIEMQLSSAVHGIGKKLTIDIAAGLLHRHALRPTSVSSPENLLVQGALLPGTSNLVRLVGIQKKGPAHASFVRESPSAKVNVSVRMRRFENMSWKKVINGSDTGVK